MDRIRIPTVELLQPEKHRAETHRLLSSHTLLLGQPGIS